MPKVARALGRVEFGGPDLPPRRLRDLLQAQVEDSPAGSRIDWATYYFRDRALAQALISASDRGVQVNLVFEPHPRRKAANDEVIALLRDHGLNGGFHLYHPAPHDTGHIHAKIYAFSDPDMVWIGSFNPSGDDPEDADVVAEIGDQDRGHNLLVAIRGKRLASALRRHVARLAQWSRVPPRYRPAFNLSVAEDGAKLYFYPRLFPCVVERSLARLKRGDRIRAAISHLKSGELSKQMAAAAKRGVDVDVLVHDTERRVPTKLVAQLESEGVGIVRVRHPDELPMHAKFILTESAGKRVAWIGSYNFNKMSQRHNAEVLLSTDDPSLFEALADRFTIISAMAQT